jgi:hypothetical protein
VLQNSSLLDTSLTYWELGLVVCNLVSPFSQDMHHIRQPVWTNSKTAAIRFVATIRIINRPLVLRISGLRAISIPLLTNCIALNLRKKRFTVSLDK